ncbi:MAG: OmpA family protein, partial [Bacteroidota bacterium]
MNKIWLIIGLLLSVLPATAQNRATKSVSKAENLGKAVNSRYTELAPVVSPDGKTIYFTRSNHPQNNYGTENSQDTWFSKYNEERKVWSYARRLDNTFNRHRFNAIQSIDATGNNAVIRGAWKKDKFVEEGFSICRREGDNWVDPQPLQIKDFEKMASGYYSGASLSFNGKALFLYFSETKDAVKNDLYVSIIQKDGSWAKPKPLTGLNTE